jgi:hypothetical protein
MEHRNPQGLAINTPRPGELLEAEFGPRGGDEIKHYTMPAKTKVGLLFTYCIEVQR